MLNVFSKGRRKSYDCFAIEVRLKNRTHWGCSGERDVVLHVPYLEMSDRDQMSRRL